MGRWSRGTWISWGSEAMGHPGGDPRQYSRYGVDISYISQMASAAMPNINSAKIPNATQDITSKNTSVMLNWLSLWQFDFVA